MDDYYQLLDVAPDADRDHIRGAYRAKRDALQSADGDQSRSQIAQLNRAWNVLSDPTQRERYDDRLAEQRESGEDDEYDEDDDGDGDGDGDTNDRERDRKRPVPVTRAQQRAEARRKRGAPVPTIVLPDGLTMAPVKTRLQAFAFDLLVLLLLFLAVYLGGLHFVDQHFPGERKHGSDLVTQQNSVTKKINADKKNASNADKAVAAAKLKHDTAAQQKAESQGAAARAAESTATKQKDALQKRIDAINRQLSPWINLTFVVGIVVLLLYLVPSTAVSGQTLGKRIFRVRAVNVTSGSAPGFSSAMTRFGLPLLVGAFLAVPLRFGPLGLAIPVLGMIGWITKPTRQGLHDKLAKTVVVEA